MGYAIRKDKQGWRAVDSAADIDAALEDYQEQEPTPILPDLVEQHNQPLKQQLQELDGRAIRALNEAVLALIANGAAIPAATAQRLQDLEAQKQALRGQLQ